MGKSPSQPSFTCKFSFVRTRVGCNSPHAHQGRACICFLRASQHIKKPLPVGAGRGRIRSRKGK
nr:MAG TPA: hypothetical protein [Caudoviricetes sp.]